jgi:hypothetical protein
MFSGKPAQDRKWVLNPIRSFSDPYVAKKNRNGESAGFAPQIGCDSKGAIAAA